MGTRARVVLPVRWSDVDLFGHVNNAAFIRFLDDARFAAFAGMGVDAAGEIAEAVLVVVKNEIDYLAPVPFTPEPLVVEVWVSRIGSSSVDFGYEIVRESEAEAGSGSEAGPGSGSGVSYLLARSRMVQVDRASGRPRPFDDGERRALELHLDEEPVLRSW